MLLSVELKAAVLMAVFTHRLELIQALRSADRALPGHAASDASAQTFTALFCVASQSRTRSTLKPTIRRAHSPHYGECAREDSRLWL